MNEQNSRLLSVIIFTLDDEDKRSDAIFETDDGDRFFYFVKQEMLDG